MKIFDNTTISKNYKGAAIAIGNFDGMHKGHQRVFKKTKKFAKKNKIKVFSRSTFLKGVLTEKIIYLPKKLKIIKKNIEKKLKSGFRD